MKHPNPFRLNSMSPCLAAALAAWVALAAPTTAQAQPKYGPATTRLSQDHAYFQTAKATDFWSLIPYYLPQAKGSTCGLASITMVVNGARSGRDLDSETQLVTEAAVEDRIGGVPFGMKSLEHLESMTRSALKEFGVLGAESQVLRFEPAQADALTALRKVLTEAEKDPTVFLIANFDQKVFTEDSNVGHIAPIGAYDAQKKRVLILDPDRKWYEPYWVPDELLLKGIQTRDRFRNELRGLVRIRIPAQ
jgi:hypothetical protein